MKESKPLPKVATSAFALLQASFQRTASDLATQTLDLKPEGEGWAVNFDTQSFERTVPDEAA